MVNDRGTIKWSSLMLPEHVEMLRQLWAEDKNKQRPILDEQQLEEMNTTLQEALYHQIAITITIYENHNYKTFQGTIIVINLNQSYLKLKTINLHPSIVTITLSTIIQVELT